MTQVLAQRVYTREEKNLIYRLDLENHVMKFTGRFWAVPREVKPWVSEAVRAELAGDAARMPHPADVRVGEPKACAYAAECHRMSHQ